MNQNTSSCLAEGGKKGHPVLIIKSNLLDILAANDDTPLRELIDFNALQIDGGLLSLNIDTPADLDKLAENSDFFDEL